MGHSSDDSFSVYDIESGAKSWGPLRVHNTSAANYAFSADGKSIVSIGEDGLVCILDVSAGSILHCFPSGQPGSLFGLTVSPNGQAVATSGNDGAVRIWRVTTGERIGQAIASHASAMWRLEFSALGDRFVSGGHDARVIFWDGGTGSQTGNAPVVHSTRVDFVSFLNEA